MKKSDPGMAIAVAQTVASFLVTCLPFAFPHSAPRAEIARWSCVALGGFLCCISARRIIDEIARRRAVREILEGVEKIVGGNYAMRFLARDDSSFGEILLALNRLVEILESDRAKAIRSERSRKSLLSDISHDIRTPLTSIIGYIGALRDGIAGDADERDSYVRILDAKSRALKVMIDDIFQLAKLDSDEIVMNPESLDLCELSREILIDFLPEFSVKSIELVADIPDAAIFVFADRLSAERIVRNLVQNALVHGGEDNVIRVSVAGSSSESPSGQLASLTVADRGRGIPFDDLPHVFDRLYRRDVARGSSSGGSGLGLAIVQSLASKNGAVVAVTSEPGGETSFSVSFMARGCKK
jgi:signal transduction histidine kinase